MTPERIAELRLHEKHLRASGQMVGACLGECLDALEVAQDELTTARKAIQESMEERRVTEAAGTPDFYAIGRLRARVAELEVEVNLLHRQRHAAQEAAANARLLAAVCHPAPDVVPVPRDELATLRDGFGLLRTAWNLSLCGERIGAQVGALIERYDALRSGEAGKGGAT